MDTAVIGERIAGLTWRPDPPALIERALPAQKISIEAQRERKANLGQTLTSLGSYWKGRKPLFLVRAIVLASLLPSTGSDEQDLEIFELLAGIHEGQTKARLKNPLSVNEVIALATDEERRELIEEPDAEGERPRFAKIARDRRLEIMSRIVARQPYAAQVEYLARPEEVSERMLVGPYLPKICAALGISADSVAELLREIGRVRFGRPPIVSDPFSGGGSIPFEAARLGCDVEASDLNPVACMLTLGAFKVFGATARERTRIRRAIADVTDTVEQQIRDLGVERNEAGDQAKSFLYCVETTCPRTGWTVPMIPNLVISRRRGIVARLVPNHAAKRFDIQVVSVGSADELKAAALGTVRDGNLVYSLDGEEHVTPIRVLRNDRRVAGSATANDLRLWELDDFLPRQTDILRERLYCIHWICASEIEEARPETYFAAPTSNDLKREASVHRYVGKRLSAWLASGVVPTMPIEPGDKTNELIRTRGWTHWHHLFGPRNLLTQALLREAIRAHPDFDEGWLTLAEAKVLDWNNRICHWHNGWDKPERTFYNQSLNTFFNFGVRAAPFLLKTFDLPTDVKFRPHSWRVRCVPAEESCPADIFVTDPPYADAVHYHEITEFFIAWLRADPPHALSHWRWDSRRALAIRGDGEGFRRSMIRAYSAMTAQMPDNGLQVIMFTHQSGAIWADLATIMWASGLRVTAAWYISTETASELKKGGYVQGTVLLIVRKRLEDARAYEDELAAEIRAEARAQIETLTGLKQRVKARSARDENLFEDADLQMAGFAAALRVLTGYRFIGGKDMTQEALRPKARGEVTDVDRFIELAVGIATEYLIPEGIPPATWGRLGPEERFYLKMIGLEAEGLKKLDNYQNFAKAYRVPDFQPLMASMAPNAARLKTASEMRRGLSEGRFGQSMTRAVLYAIQALAADADGAEVLHGLKDAVPGYLERKRDGDLEAVVRYLERRTAGTRPEESRAAKILAELLYNDHL